MAARSKAWVSGISFAGMAGSNSAHQKITQNIYCTYIHHSQIWYRDELSRCQLDPLVSCSNDEHQTSLKWDRSSHPVAPECRLSHTLRLKYFKIKFLVPFEPSCLAYWDLCRMFVFSNAVILCHCSVASYWIILIFLSIYSLFNNFFLASLNFSNVVF